MGLEMKKEVRMGWFEVDKEGLAKLLARRGKGFVLNELIQNAWDTDAKVVKVTLAPMEGVPFAGLVVEDDDPEGFKDLSHAFTLFAESEKKGDPEKRGRFNLGEKLVLALCREARITTTKGCLYFDEKGRHAGRERREKGSAFTATLRLTRAELSEVESAILALLPPAGITTTYNMEPIQPRAPLAVFEMKLPTEISDEEGMVRRTARNTKVEVHSVRAGELASIYEMGIPIVGTGDRWHYNVMQKVPLNVDRDNVTPAYLQAVRAEVLNRMHDQITKEDSTASWVRDAAADERASKEAVEQVVTLRFGEKRVIADPSDPEGTKRAMSEGYTVIPPGALSGREWANVKAHGIARPAGQVTPSPKPYADDGRPLNAIPEAEWTKDMNRIVAYARTIARRLLGHDIRVEIVREFGWQFAATYGRSGGLVLNFSRLGRAWFALKKQDADVNEILIHEFAHEFESDHLSDGFHRAICELGARLTVLALAEPEIWK